MSVVIVGLKKVCHVLVLKISEPFNSTVIIDQNTASSLLASISASVPALNWRSQSCKHPQSIMREAMFSACHHVASRDWTGLVTSAVSLVTDFVCLFLIQQIFPTLIFVLCFVFCGGCLDCMGVYVSHMCLIPPMEPQENIGYSGTGVTDGHEPPHGCWELNLGPL